MARLFEKNKDLYVINDGDKYMVSKLPFEGYTPYRYNNGCWVPSGEIIVKATKEETPISKEETTPKPDIPDKLISTYN